jgi:hypothetical protein
LYHLAGVVLDHTRPTALTVAPLLRSAQPQGAFAAPSSTGHRPEGAYIAMVGMSNKHTKTRVGDVSNASEAALAHTGTPAIGPIALTHRGDQEGAWQT